MSRLSKVLVSVCLVAVVAVALAGVTARADSTVVVKPSVMNGWYFWNDAADTFLGSPGTLEMTPLMDPPAPLGAGSVRLGPLTSGSGANGQSVIATNAFDGTLLSTITSLTYKSKQSGPTNAIALQFDVRYRVGDGFGGRLVFEPYQNGTVVVGSGWQTWSPLAGKWWATRTAAPNGTGGVQVVPLPVGNCGISAPCTWAQILASFPAAQIGNGQAGPGAGRLLLKSGSGPGWVGFDGNADALTIGVSGNNTTFDFEAEVGCTTDCYVDAGTGNDAFGGDTPVAAKKTIQAAVTQVSPGGTVHVAFGTYHEDVTIPKTLSLLGAGIDASIVSGVSGGGGSTIQVGASNVLIDGFTITRDGNAVATWNDPLNTAGVAVQGLTSSAEIRNSKMTGNRNGIDINNSNGNSIHNNIIDFNRTGVIFRNQTNNTVFVENFVTNNWTVGVLFLDGSGGTNSPLQQALNSGFNNNDISGNWYGQVVDRQTGGALPAPGANSKDFTLNWWGTINPVVTSANSTEPGYAAQIPVAYGGSAVPPGGQPDIAGPASANIGYVPLLCTGTDTDVETTPGRGTLGFQGDPTQNTFYADADNDGFGNPSVTTQACSAPPGYVADNTDPDDNNPAVFPGATGTITVHKIVDAGGAAPIAFCFTLSPDPGIGQKCAAGGNAVFMNVPLGTYSAIETGSLASYHEVSNACSNLVIAGQGSSATCDVHNTINTGTITVHKTVDAGGGSPTLFCFTLSPNPGNGQICANGAGNAIFTNVPAGTYSATETAKPATYSQVSNNCTGLVIDVQGSSKTCDVHNTFVPVTHDVEVHLTPPAEIKLGPSGVNTSDFKGDCKNKTGPESVRCTVQLTALPMQCTVQSSGPDKMFGTGDDGPVIPGPGSMAGGNPNPTFLVDTTSSYAMNETKKFDFKLKTTCTPNLAAGVTVNLNIKACADGGFLDPTHPCEDLDIKPKHAPNVVEKTVKLKK